MDVLFVLLPVALVVAAVMLALFVWAVRSGQYDDLDTPAVRILFDDQPAKPRSEAHDETKQRHAARDEAAARNAREPKHSTGIEIR